MNNTTMNRIPQALDYKGHVIMTALQGWGAYYRGIPVGKQYASLREVKKFINNRAKGG